MSNAKPERCPPGQHLLFRGKCLYCGAELETRNSPHQQRFAPPTIEHRYSTLKSASVNVETRTWEGYAVVWGVKNAHKEIFRKGAFARTLGEWKARGEWPAFYLGHDWNQILGPITNMVEDDHGLFTQGRYLKSPLGDHGLALVREEVATQLSIGFIHDDYEVENEQDWENRTVHVKEVTLYEVSQVLRGSDPAAGITHVRIHPGMSRREIEDFLHSHGATRGAARALASAWKPPEKPRDAGAGGEAEQRDAAALQRLEALMRGAADDYRKPN